MKYKSNVKVRSKNFSTIISQKNVKYKEKSFRKRMQLSEQLIEKLYSEYSCSLGYSFANSIRGGNRGTFSKAHRPETNFFFFF